MAVAVVEAVGDTSGWPVLLRIPVLIQPLLLTLGLSSSCCGPSSGSVHSSAMMEMLLLMRLVGSGTLVVAKYRGRLRGGWRR